MRTTKAERKRRREAALQKVANGYGYADVVAWVSQEWGCSRRTALRDANWAHAQLVQGLQETDIQALLAHLCTSAQRVALRAESAGQYAAAIGALKLLHEMLIRPHQAAQQREQVRRGRPGNG